jgi:hypothetical protein
MQNGTVMQPENYQTKCKNADVIQGCHTIPSAQPSGGRDIGTRINKEAIRHVTELPGAGQASQSSYKVPSQVVM